MGAGLDPGLSETRVKNVNFYTSAEAAGLGVEPVYLNVNKWALDLFKQYFTDTRLMTTIAKFDLPWAEERYLYAASKGIGLGNNGLTARVRTRFRELARDVQLTYDVPFAFIEFGPDARVDSGPDGIKGTADDVQVKLIEVYKRGMGIDGSDPLYDPWSRISYMPAGNQREDLETEQEWMDALEWVYGAALDSNQPQADTTPPSIPTNLTANLIFSSHIRMTWTASTDNVGIVAYNIYRNGTQIATTKRTKYLDRKLSNATNYIYTVAAYDAAGNTSEQSAPVTATILP